MKKLLTWLVLVATIGFPAVAQSPQKRSGAVTVDKIQIEIPDLLVMDQDGVKRRFYSDLIKDKVVILSFFFSSCPTMCPVMNNTLGKLQTYVGGCLGKGFFHLQVKKKPKTHTKTSLAETIAERSL